MEIINSLLGGLSQVVNIINIIINYQNIIVERTNIIKRSYDISIREQNEIDKKLDTIKKRIKTIKKKIKDVNENIDNFIKEISKDENQLMSPQTKEWLKTIYELKMEIKKGIEMVAAFLYNIATTYKDEPGFSSLFGNEIEEILRDTGEIIETLNKS